jgi:hypothetical protein
VCPLALRHLTNDQSARRDLLAEVIEFLLAGSGLSLFSRPPHLQEYRPTSRRAEASSGEAMCTQRQTCATLPKHPPGAGSKPPRAALRQATPARRERTTGGRVSIVTSTPPISSGFARMSVP